MAEKPQTIINMANTDRETIISIILGAIVVIVIGALAFRYFRNSGSSDLPSPTPELTNEQLVQVEELPQGDIETEETPEGNVPSNLPVQYTVKAGDSTWAIAEAFYGSGFNYVDIEAANNLTADQGLVAGQQLTIPRVPVRTAETAGAPREVTSENGAMPSNQPTRPTKGDDSAAEQMLSE